MALVEDGALLGSRQLDMGHSGFDDPHVLVAEDDAGLGGGPTLVHVQVRPADARRRDLYDGVVGMQDLRVVHILDGHLERLFVIQRLS